MPSPSVAVPACVSFTRTVTPGNVNPSAADVTVPITSKGCGRSVITGDAIDSGSPYTINGIRVSQTNIFRRYILIDIFLMFILLDYSTTSKLSIRAWAVSYTHLRAHET